MAWSSGLAAEQPAKGTGAQPLLPPARMDAAGAATPQHGLQPDTMALITSDYDAMRDLIIKWP